MEIWSTSARGNFEIKSDSGERLLELTYSNWFASKAETLFESDKIEIELRNIWHSKFHIVKNGLDNGYIELNWNGDVRIILKSENGVGKQYALKAVGFWEMGFELFDQYETKILSLKQNFNWKRISYNYGIEIADNQEVNHEMVELILYSGFAANLFMAMAVGG
ncbi:aminotransferase [Dyadobacter aurulentus]|uniref:aminotransferase n=1 Tax=Dyadobacter sp. UC 10 TaxID=2605428 RepID=UPI0011F19B11|nr:aminotransferase [Dyadobacter sp. UC 10]KAA0993639.1 aminotransferase [Dyadobacter sp. UC 10]